MARILIVDDVPEVRELLTHLLEYDGHETLVASSGAEAIALAQQELPDLIIMDLLMPVIDGWSATRQLKGDPRTAHIPVIALTAHLLPEDEREAMAAGCDRFLAKPLDIDYFLEQVAILTNRSTAVGGEEEADAPT